MMEIQSWERLKRPASANGIKKEVPEVEGVLVHGVLEGLDGVRFGPFCERGD